MFKRSVRKGNYEYTVTRVKAKKSKLLREEDYDKMIQMSLPEISRYISEAGYQKEIADLAGKYSDIALVEHATYQNMANVFKSILGASQGELATMVGSYLEKWDIWNLKVILRGKSYGLDAEGMREDFVPAGKVDAADLEKLLSLDSIDDVLNEYSKVGKVKFPPEVISEYKETQNLGVIEDFLDKYHYQRLLDSINPYTRPTKIFLDYIRKDIDVVNLRTIMKLKSEGITGDQAMKYFIPGGMQIDSKFAQVLANAETVSAAAGDMSRLEVFEDYIKPVLDTDSTTNKAVVSAIKKYQGDQANKMAHMYPLSVLPVIDFMVHKETEVRNIRIVARGVDGGLSRETIKGLLVI
ncbi:MAG: ATP synthase A1 subunit C [Candidatus Methanomethylophilaceae archaeon]|nr:ATP synthase A1 subunit C [Candidatus Methanomethylophilaceae archaeon]